MNPFKKNFPIEFVIEYLYNNGPAPDPLGNGDIDSIIGITNNDVQFLVNYFFEVGEAPFCSPFTTSIIPISADTLEILGGRVLPGDSQTIVTIWQEAFHYPQPSIQSFSFPFSYNCSTSVIICDSISFIDPNNIFSYFFLNYENRYSVIDSCLRKGVVAVENVGDSISSTPYGTYASLWFTITPSADTQYVLIDTTDFNPSHTVTLTRLIDNSGMIETEIYKPEITGLTPISSQPCCIGYRGNINGSSCDEVNIGDLVYFVNYMFNGGDAPPCTEEADVNGSGVINIADLTYFINFEFKGGSEPTSCW